MRSETALRCYELLESCGYSREAVIATPGMREATLWSRGVAFLSVVVDGLGNCGLSKGRGAYDRFGGGDG